MRVTILGLRESRAALLDGDTFDAIISIADPGPRRPELNRADRPVMLDAHAPRVLRLDFDDVEYTEMSWRGESLAPPTHEHAKQLIDFINLGLAQLRNTSDGEGGTGGHWLVHCHAGVSRSTAAALVLLGYHYGFDVPSLGSTLKRIRPVATPNRLLIARCEDELAARGLIVDGRRPLSGVAQSCLPDGFPPLALSPSAPPPG